MSTFGNSGIASEQRIVLRALLGSDRVRECLSWVRYLNHDDEPTLFFEKAPKVRR